PPRPPPLGSPLALHAALPISRLRLGAEHVGTEPAEPDYTRRPAVAMAQGDAVRADGEKVWLAQAGGHLSSPLLSVDCRCARRCRDRKSTPLNSSHVKISYAVF